MNDSPQITTPQAFRDSLGETDDYGWWFRGVQEAEHELVPKVGRPFGDEEDKRPLTDRLEECRALEDKLIEGFRRHALPHLRIRPENDWEWLGLAQHHGLPTRLLDWTQSPLVAAFFACSKEYREDEQKKDAAIYAFKRDEYVDTKTVKDPFGTDGVVLFKPTHLSPRIPAQSGVFTVHPDPITPFDDGTLRKWVLSAGFLDELRRMLSKYGINHRTMFPDLDGLARQLAWFHGGGAQQPS